MPSNLDHIHQAPGATGYQYDHPAAAHVAIRDADAGDVDLLGDRTKIAICGFASSSRGRIPVNDPDWVVTGMNQLYRHIPRADFWFDIHRNWTQDNVEGTDHPKWLSECRIPVFMVDRQPSIPTSVRYPIERLIAKFGIDYFTSSVSLMIALAIDAIDRKVQAKAENTPAIETHNGHSAVSVAAAHDLMRSLYSEYSIGIFGIDLIVGDEYDFQKSCAEFWLGMAASRNITVTLPPETALLKQRWRYGYQAEPGELILKVSELQGRAREHAAMMAKLQEDNQKNIATMQTIDGARQELEHQLRVIELRMRGGQIPLLAGEAK